MNGGDVARVRAADYPREIEQSLARAKWADFAVAFATERGVTSGDIERSLEEFLKSGGRLRVMVDLRLANTDPQFLARLLALRSKGFRVQCRCYVTLGDGVFHPKLYVFGLKSGSVLAICGSANWTGPAYASNVEYGLVLEGKPGDEAIRGATGFFEHLWSSPQAKRVTRKTLDAYETYWLRRHEMDDRLRKRSAPLWGKVQGQLAAGRAVRGFRWPSEGAAFLLGCLAARGSIDRRRRSITIHFRYGGSAYRHGKLRAYVGKGTVSYRADKVVSAVPQAVADRICAVVAPSAAEVHQTGKWTFEVRVDCRANGGLLDNLKAFFGTKADYRSFHVPRQVLEADRRCQADFLRGYALASGLVSGGTYDPTYRHQVWLRPATQNKAQFEQVVDLLRRAASITAHRHRRATRDVAVKIRCESWLAIGFGVDWLDALVEEGARLNRASARPAIS